ncbi:MAG: DNA polymerase/3'-5' exonuclease PolX [Planctomycetia bacterium]|nr:DNA polymerase/3'-5' exonuclease PolX [Planctomycetia bacterium]
MTNAQIAAAFDEIADILEFQGANPFRVRAYRNASRTLGDFGESIEALVHEGRDLTEIQGIGEDLAGKIETLVKTGSLPQLVDLRAQVPKTVLALMRIPGLGPKKAAALYRELSIKDLDMLKAACEAHKVRELKGFGEKTEETILKGLSLAAESQKRIYWAAADEYAQALLKHMRQCKGIEQMEVGGSYRRGKDTVGDLDLLVVSSDVAAVMDRFGAFSGVAEVLARGETKMVVRLDTGLQVDLRVVPAESFGAALQYFTGSKQHNIVLRGRAKDRGLKVSEWGVFRGEKYIGGRTEEEVYKLLDLPWIPPELREARQEFEWAESGQIPELIEVADIQGDLHMHTNQTDGAATLEEMVEAAKKRGLKYIAITDHSKRVTMANGLDGARLRRQWAEIDKLNDRVKGIKVLKGVEVDILEKGGLDLADDVLAEADWVVASLHYGQNQPREKITKRLLGALENPHVSAIGHPTGRLLERRSGYDVDLDAVFAAAKEHKKILELNANPARLDLDDVACAAAKEHGIPIVISTDAHSTQGLETIRYGVLQARRAGLTKEDVVNTRPWSGVMRLIGRK